MVPTAPNLVNSRGNALAHILSQLITMHSEDFSDKGGAIKGLVAWLDVT